MITVLPLELVQLILLFVLDTSRHSLRSVILVNKAFHDLARPVLYRRFPLTFGVADSISCDTEDQAGSPSASNRIAQLLTDESYSFALLSIQELIFSCTSLDIQLGPEVWTSVSNLISRLHNLREMMFACSVQLPTVVLDALHRYHPGAQLHVSNWTRQHWDMPICDPPEEALARSPCLRSIRVNSPWLYSDIAEAALIRVIALASNLRSICAINRPTRGYGPELRPEERIPPAKFPPSPIKDVRWPSIISLLRISQILDLSAIESLHVGVDWASEEQGSPTPLLGRTFSSVKHLHLLAPLPGLRPIVPFETLVTTCKALETLTITNHQSHITLETILLHHASSLTSLGWHQEEDIFDSRPVLSLSQLIHLRNAIPNLQNLEIDINHTMFGRQECDVYQVLASFPHLASVKLHYDVGISRSHLPGPDDEVYPILQMILGKKYGNRFLVSVRTA